MKRLKENRDLVAGAAAVAAVTSAFTLAVMYIFEPVQTEQALGHAAYMVFGGCDPQSIIACPQEGPSPKAAP